MRSLAVFTNGLANVVRVGQWLCFVIMLSASIALSQESVQQSAQGSVSDADAADIENGSGAEGADPSVSVLAEPSVATSGAPTISAHSDLTFAVYRGDTVTVEVQAQGEGLTYKWIKGKETICRAATCALDTSEWGLGSHKLSLVVFNDRGSLYLKGKIRVLMTPAGYKPSKVQAPLIEASDAIEAVVPEDLVVGTMVGRGFSYHDSKVQVVGPIMRSLDWNEKLRTQVHSTIRFGRARQEEHLLAQKSTAYLIKGSSDRRIIALRRGVLRSRQLEGKPQWSIVIDPWLQIDVDNTGDVIVERALPDDDDVPQSDVVTVTVLRGNARVYRWTDQSGQIGTSINVPQGLEVRVAKDSTNPPALVQPNAKRVQRLFKVTTPQLMPGKDPSAAGEGWTLQGKDRAREFPESLKKAQAAFSLGDYMLVLEMLTPFKDQVSESYDASVLLGEAGVRLALFDLAMGALNRAAELNPDAPEPAFLLGYVALAGRQWRQAEEYFETADDLSHPQALEVSYYLGVARTHLGKTIAARQAFTYSLWEDGPSAVEESSRQFLDHSRAASWFEVHLFGGVIRDTNVLRTNGVDLEALGDGSLDSNSSLAYVGRASFTAYAYRATDAHLAFRYDIDRKDYAAKSLKLVGRIEQRLSTNLAVSVGGGDLEGDGRIAKPIFHLDIGAFAETMSVGEERAMDRMGSLLMLGVPRLWNLKVRATSAYNLDPLPYRDDIFDPLAGEVVAANDRSSRSTMYGLAFVPYETETWRLGIDVTDAKTVMLDEAVQGDGHTDLDVNLTAHYTLSLRQVFGAGLLYHMRSFALAEDERRDKTTALSVAWQWHYTPALYQLLEAKQEAQRSTRTENAYERRELALGWGLAF